MEAVVVVLGLVVLVMAGMVAWVLRSGGVRAGSGGGLEAERARIDERLNQMNEAVASVSEAMKSDGLQRATLAAQLEQMGRETAELNNTTQGLARVLSGGQARGQWGERIAEDILRRVGMLEGTSYRKQVTQPGGAGRPDFVFYLTDDTRLNMDVKFPFDNYARSLESESDTDRERYERDFLRDVRGHITALATRDYIDPANGTADYVLLFIPNEGVYRFIHETGPEVFDEALDKRVVCCSPQMLFAMLALIRQAADTLATRQAAEEIVGLLGAFNKQWGLFSRALDKLGRRIGSVAKDYETLSGRRQKALRRPLDRIEALRQQRGIPIAADDLGDAQLALDEPGEEDEED